MLRWTMALAAVLALSLVMGACQAEPTPTPTPTPAPTPSPTDTPQPEPTPTSEDAPGDAASPFADPADLAAHLSARSMEMWEVYNAYDLEGLRAFYEESYWQEQEAALRSNMQPFQARGATFEAEETSPPTEIAPGRWEVRHRARFPGGSVKMVFIYEQFDGRWLFTHAEVE